MRMNFSQSPTSSRGCTDFTNENRCEVGAPVRVPFGPIARWPTSNVSTTITGGLVLTGGSAAADLQGATTGGHFELSPVIAKVAADLAANAQ
jgi:hypothetical protein